MLFFQIAGKSCATKYLANAYHMPDMALNILNIFSSLTIICFLRASVVRPDFHLLAVMNPGVRIHSGKTGHSDFNLKFRASREYAVFFHLMLLLLVKRIPAVANYTLWP